MCAFNRKMKLCSFCCFKKRNGKLFRMKKKKREGKKGRIFLKCMNILFISTFQVTQQKHKFSSFFLISKKSESMDNYWQMELPYLKEK